MLAGWSPERLSLAGPTPDLFPLPEGEGGLSEAESAAARDGRRRIAALADVGWYDGTGLAGIDAPEAVRRLAAVPPDPGLLAELLDDPYGVDTDDSLRKVGVTTVAGGCVVTQPLGVRAAGDGRTGPALRRHRLLRRVRQPQERQPGQPRARRSRIGPNRMTVITKAVLTLERQRWKRSLDLPPSLSSFRSFTDRVRRSASE
ncbi:hypothetical protein [Streptomyces capoamus]|uniref:hypothetical protein n=1 Tax=Streptomyces capoamus TaxID=68183 RepID=UPI003394F11C